MRNLFLTMLLTAFAFTSCGKEDGGDQAPLILTGGTTTSQTIYADQTSGAGNGIKFKATAPWTATVTAIAGRAGGSDLDWLTLNTYSGDAGEQTLTMTLKENLTGADRKAQIAIVCGGTTITISVEQKGTTQSGEKPEARATYITPEGKIMGGEIFGGNLPTELKWLMMRMDDISIDHYSPTSYPYAGKTFNITLPTPSDELLGAFVAEHDNTTKLTIVPSDAKFSHSVLDYDGGSISLTNLSWQNENSPNYKMKKGDGYVEFVYASKAVTVNGTIIGDFDQQQTFIFTNCTFRQGWNEMVVIAAEDAAADGSVTVNVTTNNAPSTFQWVAQENNFDPGVVRQVSKITESYKSNKEERTLETIFLYDAQNRITTAKMTHIGVPESNFLDKYTWEYNGNTVICKQYLIDMEGDNSEAYTTTATSTFSLNTDGSVKSAIEKRIQKQGETVRDAYDGTKTYTYTDGFLTQQHKKGESRYEGGTTYQYDQKRVITWEDGNMTREDVAEDKWYTKYEYKDRYDKKSNIDIAHIAMKLDEMEIVPLNLGKYSQDLISKMSDFSGVELNGGEVEYNEYNYNYTYEYDTKGYVVKIKETTDDGSHTVVITYQN